MTRSRAALTNVDYWLDYCSTATKQVEDQHYRGNNQKQVNETAADAADQT